MKNKIVRALSIFLSGSLLLSTANYIDTANNQKTLSDSYYTAFCSHLGTALYREIGSVSISNANLVNSYLSEEFSDTRFDLKDDGTVVAYISDNKWNSVKKGINNILNDKTATDSVVEIVQSEINNACVDLAAQIENASQMVIYCDSAIESVNQQFGEQNAKFLLQEEDSEIVDSTNLEDAEDSSTLEPISIAERDEQLEALENMKEDYELKSTSISYFDNYASSVNLASYIPDDAANIDSSCDELSNTTSVLISDIDGTISELQQAGVDTTELTNICADFTASANQAVSDVKFSCDNLLQTNMDGADLELYMQNECADINNISSSLSDNNIINGLYDSADTTDAISDDSIDDEDLTASEGTAISYTDEDIENIKTALAQIQEQLNSFESKYGNAIADVSEEVNAVTSVMKIMGDGGIYADYMDSLNDISSDLCNQLDELRTESATSPTDTAIDSITQLVDNYTQNADEKVSSLQTEVDSAISSITTNTMNMDAFSEYQDYVINLATTSSDSIASLQTSIETEAAERKTADEKLSQAIGAIRSDVMYLIGSSSISNVGSSITAAIGNTSLAGIGDGTISGAISSLNNSLATLSIIGTIYAGRGDAVLASGVSHPFYITLPSNGVWVVSVTGRVQSNVCHTRFRLDMSGYNGVRSFDGEIVDSADIYPMATISNVVVGNKFTIGLLQCTGSSCKCDYSYAAVRIR